MPEPEDRNTEPERDDIEVVAHGEDEEEEPGCIINNSADQSFAG